MADNNNDLCSQQNDLECAICFSWLKEKCVLPCGHEFCKECIYPLLRTSFQKLHRKIFNCPMCRKELSFHDIICDSTNLFPSQQKSIFGCVYVQGICKGLASYHFDSTEYCYISYSSPRCLMWPALSDGSRPPLKKPFENHSFDPESRTFRGDIVWSPNSWENSILWKYEMIFSEDFDTIEGGCVKGYNTEDEEPNCDYFGKELIYNRYYKEITNMLYPGKDHENLSSDEESYSDDTDGDSTDTEESAESEDIEELDEENSDGSNEIENEETESQ